MSFFFSAPLKRGGGENYPVGIVERRVFGRNFLDSSVDILSLFAAGVNYFSTNGKYSIETGIFVRSIPAIVSHVSLVNRDNYSFQASRASGYESFSSFFFFPPIFAWPPLNVKWKF